MKRYQIPEIRQFMISLFESTSFDSFYVTEADITTFVNYHIDGSLHAEYLSDSDKDDRHTDASEYASWQLLKKTVFELIRGNVSPESMRIVMKLSERSLITLLERSGLPLSASDVSGLYLNITYTNENKQLFIITGASLTRFIPDKSLERVWDDAVLEFLHHHHIFTE